MKAIQIQQYGGEEQLQMVEVPKPKAGKDQVVVRIAATTFNPFDFKLASGAMKQMAPLQFPFVPGVDFSGVVDAVGEGVSEFRAGDEVFGDPGMGGTYAEFIAVGAGQTALKPKKLNHIEAASLAMVAQTAMQMVDRANLQKGQTVLIQGASGAVGSVAVQIAHHLGAKVIATSTAGSAQRLKQYGADVVVDYKTQRFEDHAKNVDAVLDAVGGEVQERSFDVLKPGGVLVAITQPPSEELAKKHQVKASMVVTRSSSECLRRVAELADARHIQPFIGKVYPLSEVRTAWQEARTGRVEGKIVLQVAADMRRSAGASE
jgi:NADPH:quinone reductase-like Zn-dependent oxidoreductase